MSEPDLFGYARESVGRAVSLLVEEGVLRERLKRAGRELAAATPSALPTGLGACLEQIHRDLGIASAQEDGMSSTVDEMSPADTARLADQIVALFVKLWEETGRRAR